MKYSLFIDFDGTIAVQDVGNRFFTTFSKGKNIPVVERWMRREISSIECLKSEAELISAGRDELIEFSQQFAIDDGFESLYELCMREDIPVRVVSDGLDIYINTVMEKHGFGSVTVMANRAVFEDGHLTIEFPHLDTGCDHCANCKGASIRKYTEIGRKSIFVGDGYSDICAIDVADYLFAKADLANYLERLNRSYIAFSNLHDVKDYIEKDLLDD
jgi:2-hydroxy-3-keto-5-methylthiopentenyl-1-phosphate phosphatase